MKTLLTLFLLSLTVFAAQAHELSAVRRSVKAPPATCPENGKRWNTPDHPDWYHFNGQKWYTIDPSMQDHGRFHCYLSMAAYGNYAKLCPSSFPSGFSLIEEFSTPNGQSGFVARIPIMNKIVIVFKGTEDWSKVDWTPVNIDHLAKHCRGCTVAKTVYDLYMAARKATNRFEKAHKAWNGSGMRFSATGHGMGGAVAAMAGLEMRYEGLKYIHTQGTPRVFNYAAAVRFDNNFKQLSGQALVARNDKIVHVKPQGPWNYHIGQKTHITGDKTQWWTTCWGNNENSTCLGDGSSEPDHWYYFTPKGHCGSANKGF